MHKPPMDLLSLPGDFKIQIFKKLDWRNLKNLKLVCKDLYFVIEKNIRFLGRPKVYSLSITYDEIKISKVDYRFILTEDTWRGGLLKVVEFSNFTEIKELRLTNGLNGEYISIHYESYSSRDFSRYTFSTGLKNGRCYRDYPFVTIKNSRKFGILYDGNLLKMDSLGRFRLFEENGPCSVGKKIAMDFLTDNPMLEYEKAPTNVCKLIDIQITNHLLELRLLNPENTCVRKGFKLLFNKVYKYGVVRQKYYSKLFDKIKFNSNLVEKNNHDVYLISSSMKCSKCGVKHGNFILYDKDSKEFSITLH
uniref:F-box domain-containing protein n=1 Tax=Strongyloides papillosus TaxID=174720 RepID=A0A0N5BUW6_STREA